MRVPISVLVIIIILVGMKWYLIVVLTFISLMTNVLTSYLYIIFGEMSVQIICPFFSFFGCTLRHVGT